MFVTSYATVAIEIIQCLEFWLELLKRMSLNVFHNEYRWKFYIWCVLALIQWYFSKVGASVSKTVQECPDHFKCGGWMPLSQFVAIFLLEDVALLLYTFLISKSSQFHNHDNLCTQHVQENTLVLSRTNIANLREWKSWHMRTSSVSRLNSTFTLQCNKFTIKRNNIPLK